MTHPECRLATPRDSAACSRIVAAGWRDSYADFLPASLLDGLEENPHHDAESWHARIAAPSARTWVISAKGGTEIGVVRLELATSITGTRSELTTLYVDAAWRNRGVGSAALAHVLTEARRHDALPLGVGVLSANRRGRRFYEQHGGRLVGERVAFVWAGEAIDEAMYMMGTEFNAH
jgi:GNAT superfamily N-acetyltransferase